MELAYIVYTCLFGITLIFAYLGIIKGGKFRFSRNSQWIFWSIAIILYTIVLGLRKDVGIDYRSYSKLFDLMIRYGETARETDVIYHIFMPIIRIIHYNFFIAFLAFINIFFLFLSLKDKTNILLLYLFFFFAFMSFFSSLNLMRQYSACFIALYSIFQYLKTDYKKFIIYLFIAIIFHKSVLILLPFILLSNKYDFSKWRWFQFILLISTFMLNDVIFERLDPLITSVKFPDFIGSYYLTYIENFAVRTARVIEYKNARDGTGLFPFLLLFINCLVIFFSSILKKKYSKYHFNSIYNLYLVGILLSPIFDHNEGTARVIKYFSFFSIYIYSILFYHLFYRIKKDRLYWQMLTVGIMLTGVVFFYTTIYRKAMGIAPFQFIEF